MKTLPFFVLVVLAGSPVLAEETRQHDSHEHGVGQLDIALDGQQIAIELHAPGADIVGFEYAAESDEDRAAVDAAFTQLARPLDLFGLPAAAECTVVKASAELESEEEHAEHGHSEEEHADQDDHSDDDHKDEDHEGHDDHDEHKHSEDEHEEAGHSEFHAEYLLTCADPAAISEMKFAYFEVFKNALELEVQVISDAGAKAFEVERDNPTLDMTGMF